MATEFGTGKTVFILAIVVGCFAILWPKIFYPMLQGSVSPKPNTIAAQDCCDVFFDKDLNAIKIMTELCERILSRQSDFDQRLILNFRHGKLTKEIVDRCKNEVFDKCGIDITSFLKEKVRLGRTYKQILDEIRSLNSSLCLKEKFGIPPGLIGVPRRMRIWSYTEPKHLRQERPPHLRPDIMHPALREKGRAIPQSHIVPKVMDKETQGRPYPMPGIRPPMGGAGHVVPAPKGSGTMGIIMPLYTIGIVVFFMYTMMKLIFKKTEDSSSYKELAPDPEFHRMVFSDTEYSHAKVTHDLRKVNEENGTKLGDIELDQLRKRLEETEAAMERIVAQMVSVPPKARPSYFKGIESEKNEVKELVETENKPAVEDGKAVVQVVGMEMTESCEKGQKWSRPATPTARCVTPTAVISVVEPQNIYLEGALPSQSQLLVSQSETQRLPPENEDSSIILAGKVTLSLIGVDSTIRGKDKENTTVVPAINSSGNVSEDESEGSDNVNNAEADLIHDGLNGDDDPTNYTTASGAGGDETAADISTMDGLGQEIPEEVYLEEEVNISNGDDEVDLEEEEGEEEEEDDEEEDENEEIRPKPQSLQHQHER